VPLCFPSRLQVVGLSGPSSLSFWVHAVAGSEAENLFFHALSRTSSTPISGSASPSALIHLLRGSFPLNPSVIDGGCTVWNADFIYYSKLSPSSLPRASAVACKLGVTNWFSPFPPRTSLPVDGGLPRPALFCLARNLGLPIVLFVISKCQWFPSPRSTDQLAARAFASHAGLMHRHTFASFKRA